MASLFHLDTVGDSVAPIEVVLPMDISILATIRTPTLGDEWRSVHWFRARLETLL